jgi:hypothetical protein
MIGEWSVKMADSSLPFKFYIESEEFFLAEAQSSQRKLIKHFWLKHRFKDLDFTLRTLRALREMPFWFKF